MHRHALRVSLLLATSTIAFAATSADAQAADPTSQTQASPSGTQTTVPTSDAFSGTGAAASEQLATQAPPPPEGEIVVTGTRAALENAERIKRNSDVMLDGISADQIGQLPDASMSDAVVSVPGVLSNGNGGLSARGLGPDFIVQEINGRLLPSAQPQTRLVQSGTFPTEGISGIFLQKTPEASTIEGGAGGTVLIETIHPLETKLSGLDLIVRGYTNTNSAKLSAANGYADVAPRVSVSYVKRLAPNFGIALTYSMVRQYEGFIWNDATTWAFDTSAGTPRKDLNKDGHPDALPQILGEQVGSNNDFRHSFVGMVQWDPVPSLRLSLDGFFNRDHLENSIREYFANGISNGANGPVVSSTVNQYDTVVAMNAPVTSYRGTLSVADLINKTIGGGLNAAFNNGGPISFKLDGSYFKATRSGTTRNFTFDNDATNAATQRMSFSYDVSDPRNAVYNFQPLTADDYSLTNASVATPVITDTIAALRGDFSYKPVSNGFIKSIDAGVRLEKRHKTNTPFTTNYTFGINSAGKADFTLRPDLDSSDLELTNNPLQGRNPYVSGASQGTFPWYDVNKLAALIGSPNTQAVLAPGIINGYINDAEKTAAAYAKLNVESGILSGNLGVRYVRTDATIKGLQGTVTNYSLATVKTSYHYLLPSLNAKLQFTPTLDVRFALSKTLTRPNFSDTKIAASFDPTAALTAGFATINAGNPNLKPYTAKGIDAAIEWFPSHNSSLTVNGFVRYVTGFLSAYTENGTVVVNGTTLPAVITTTINDPQVRHFEGIEITARQQFTFLPGFLSGFGVYLNYDRSFTDASDIVATILQQPTIRVPPNGFSKHIVNAQLYYSKGPLNLRFAYRYFSPNIEDGLPPAYFRALPNGALAITGSYRITKNISFLFSATNFLYHGDTRYVPDYRFPGNDYQTNKSLTSGVRGVGQDIQAGVRVHF